ncbi:peptide ABC transporter substrate-binding protein [Phragmitibacter flavus]|uniref:Peptide ABC transporter substrate-binding protein n=1 Tax=Phragmitibacter flavus TaxID=2576071 RepID=A0A5R8KLC8_9BACT|nr:peptide ABC transporter substrate-binding protein [Phragmitibacter flavus]TLD72845.1 peptide ABC transporter substrate-binding protein [Phragmitibacter flavus]
MKWLPRLAWLFVLVLLGTGFYHLRKNREPRIIAATQEKILLIGNGAELESLDPQVTTGVPERQVTSAIFESLIAYHPEDDYLDAPGAAARWEHQDFRIWTFHLQPNARWSDGVPVTAHDFTYAFQRILTPALASQYAEMLYFMEGAEAFNKGENQDFSKVGVKALDDLTLQVTLVNPTPYFTSVIKHHSWQPVPRHVIEKTGGMIDRFSTWTRPEHIVSNGPFKLQDWRFMQWLKVERNPHYWDAATVRLDGIHYFPITNESTEDRAFRDGQLHATNTVPLDRIPAYRANHPEVYREETQLAVYFYRLNTTLKPFNDVRIRKALALSIDRESIIRNVLRGAQRPAVGFTPTAKKGYEGVDLMRFDPAQAKALLAEAGYPDGKGFPKFEILINTMEAHRLIAQAVQSMWREHLGIDVGIINQDWQVYLDSQRRMDYEISRAAWSGDYMDPMTFLGMWTKDNGNNQTGWHSSRYEELLRQSSTIADPPQRFAVLKEAETLFLNELPVIPVYWYARSSLVRPEVKGMRSSLLDDRPYKWFDLQAPSP